MLTEVKAGLVKAGDGVPTVARSSQQGDLIVSQLHGSMYEQAVRGNLGFSMVMDAAMSVSTATAQIGNIVWNPPNSGVNLSLRKWAVQNTVTDINATQSVLCVGYQAIPPTSITAATSSGSTLLAQPTLTPVKARAYSIATVLIAPVIVMPLTQIYAAINTVGEEAFAGDIDGLFTIGPGGFVTISTTVGAAATAGVCSFLSWEEVPLL